jgi:diguanylate cyclase (GGDEF)-like protein
MSAVSNPKRTPVFRLLTIASSGIGSFILGIWGLKLGLGGGFAGISADMMVAIMAALCALAASVAAMSFFAGVDESADFVFNETHFDKLTGLLARPAMVGKIAEAACATSRTGEPMFLIDIDIDRFKHINDAIGYSQGDELIRAFTKRLQGCVPARALIGRIGAGEFAVLLPDHQIQGTLESMVERLIDEMMEPYDLSSHQQSVGLSVGIVAMPKDGVDPVLLLRRSNLALQNARAGGVGNWSVFDGEMGRVADYRQWVESELHTAFERGDFDLHYQPQLDLPTGRIIGYEALIRWNHPERGMIPPMEFIQIAEETGMINPIGEWVLRKACSDARHLPEDCFVAVNISPVQFMTKDFVGIVRDTMRATGIKPSRLELEVTETAMMQDRDRAAASQK